MNVISKNSTLGVREHSAYYVLPSRRQTLFIPSALHGPLSTTENDGEHRSRNKDGEPPL